MKKRLLICTVLTLAAVVIASPYALAEGDSPKLIAHYQFAEEAVGKDSAGGNDLKAVGTDGTTEMTPKLVEGPNGLKAVEFDQSYALITDKNDVTDDRTEFTISFLIKANGEGNMRNNVFSTGLGNGNHPDHSGMNMLLNPTKGYPEVRLYGGSAPNNNGEKWGQDQFKNDDGEAGAANWKNRENPYTYDSSKWYRVVLTVQLADGSHTGTQTCYIEAMDAISSKADFRENDNYYAATLPNNLTSLKNEKYPLSIGGTYNYWVSGSNPNSFYNEAGKFYGMYIGQLADFRIYDKALTEDQIVELYKNNQLEGEDTPAPSDPPAETTAAVSADTTAKTENKTTAPAQTGKVTTSDTPVSEPQEEGPSAGMIAGIVIAAVVVLGASGAAIYLLLIRKKNGGKGEGTPPDSGGEV